MNGENLLLSAVVSLCAVIVGLVVSLFILWIIENPVYLVFVGLWIIFTLSLYFSYERHLERKKNEG